MAYRVLIIGCGAIAGGYDSDRHGGLWPLSHAGTITASEHFELVACVDPDDSALLTFAKEWEVTKAAPNTASLQASAGDFDLIVIASPTQFHAVQLEWALSMKPCAVFCEKPVTDDFSKVLPIVRAFETAKIPLAVNYTRRWAPDLAQLLSDIQNDKWGFLLSAVGTYSKGVVHNGSHMMDLLHMFVGSMELHSIGPGKCDYWDHDPTVSAMLTAGDLGQPIHLVASDSRSLTQFELVLNYDFGEIALRDGGTRIETRRVQESAIFPGHKQLGLPETVEGRYAEAMTLAYENMAQVIAGKADPNCSAGQAYSAHAICEEMRQRALENLKKAPE
ncbi:MAG: Gfo/Idh/MocA family oxidoreductase [Pseudomonadota bacterium]